MYLGYGFQNNVTLEDREDFARFSALTIKNIHIFRACIFKHWLAKVCKCLWNTTPSHTGKFAKPPFPIPLQSELFTLTTSTSSLTSPQYSLTFMILFYFFRIIFNMVGIRISTALKITANQWSLTVIMYLWLL